jgi:hypothetical protein
VTAATGDCKSRARFSAHLLARRCLVRGTLTDAAAGRLHGRWRFGAGLLVCRAFAKSCVAMNVLADWRVGSWAFVHCETSILSASV